MRAAGSLQPDADRAVDLVTRMMAIPGKSCNELAVIEFIEARLAAAGLPCDAIMRDDAHERSPAGGPVGNLIVKLPGTLKRPRRLLMAHVDTVPLCVGAQPVRRGPFIKSRDPRTALGADDRAGSCVLLSALLEILERRLPHPPLTFFWPVQEEIGLYGARFVRLADLAKPKLCFNFDGGLSSHAAIGATGDYALSIEIDGVASHAGAHPEGGVSDVAIASLAIADLVKNGWHGAIKKGRHRGTSNVGIITGGNATNVVMPHVSVRAEVRSHDPRFRRRLRDEFRMAFERAAKRVRNESGAHGRIRFESKLKYESFLLGENEPCVQTALAAIKSAGLVPSTRIANGGLDANWLTARGLPTVTLGCGQQDAHTTDESLHVPSFLHACSIGLILATATEHETA